MSSTSTTPQFQQQPSQASLSIKTRQASQSPVENGYSAVGVVCCLHIDPESGAAQPDSGDILIDPDDPKDAVRLVCSNSRCSQSRWSHKECFTCWENALIRTSRQKTPSPVILARNRCACGKGNLSPDLTYTSPKNITAARRQRQSAALNGINIGSYSPTELLSRRFRHVSTSSNQSGTFSLSPPNGESPLQINTAAFPSNNHNNSPSHSNLPFSSPAYQNRGNIFQRRNDNYSSLNQLPKTKQNKFHIVTEDDSSTDNDDLKSLVLTTLTTLNAPQVPCLICQRQMIVYDHFPLVDGTFFLSPIKHVNDSPVCGKGYLHAVCMYCMCLATSPLRCKSCSKCWDGSLLLIGGVYLFDIFAAYPCCLERFICHQCHKPAVKDQSAIPNAFSQFSQAVTCPHCRCNDFHFTKPLSHIYVQPNNHRNHTEPFQ